MYPPVQLLYANNFLKLLEWKVENEIPTIPNALGH
jgi:hypothetical protein